MIGVLEWPAVGSSLANSPLVELTTCGKRTRVSTVPRVGRVVWRESSSSEATTRVTKALSGQEWVSTMLGSRRPSVWLRPTHLHWSMPIGWRQVAQSIWRLLWNIRPCSTLDSTLASFQQSSQQKRQTKKSKQKQNNAGTTWKAETKALISVATDNGVF